MNTNLLLVTNVPKSVKPLDLLKELENKWARVIAIDNPFYDLSDVFIYNPTNLMTHYDLGVRQLREKVINGTKPLKVYHMWFPPPNVYLTNMVPDNSSMLPFLFVDNLPKDCDSYQIIGDLPFQQNEVKHWDVPQKEDKWMILRLPTNQDDAIRDYVLKYIRSRRLPNGLFPRVLEVFATEDYRLSTNMIPKKINLTPITSTFKSYLMFLYDLPANLTARTIAETAKSLNVKGTRAFFIDVVNGLRVAFLSIPKSLSYARFQIFENQLREKEITSPNQPSTFLNVNEVWLQPHGADVPHLDVDKPAEKVEEFVLTSYIYIHNVASSIDHNKITKGSPINFKVYLFQMAENQTQVGFICLRGFSDDSIVQLMKHLRGLVFEGFQVLVDNIYLKCYDLPENHSERRDVHIPRKPISLEDEAGAEIILVHNYELEPLNPDSNGDSSDELVDVTKPKIEISKEPPSDYNLMKSDFIYVSQLPIEVESSFFTYLNIDDKAITLMPSDGRKSALIYYPDTSPEQWLATLETVATSRIKGHFVEVCEVFLQSEENLEQIQTPLPAIKPSKYIFVYNIDDSRESGKLARHHNVVNVSAMETDSGSCAFVELINGLSPEDTIETLHFLRGIEIGGTPVCADLIWLGTVKVNQRDKNTMRNKWLKKPSEPSSKKMRLE